MMLGLVKKCITLLTADTDSWLEDVDSYASGEAWGEEVVAESNLLLAA